MFLNNFRKSRLILALRNSLNIKPVQIILPNDNESYSISDAFCWRNCDNFNTTFRYTDLMEYFTNIKNLNIKLVICDHNNNILNSTNFKNRDLTDKIKINDVINDSRKKSGHFFRISRNSP